MLDLTGIMQATRRIPAFDVPLLSRFGARAGFARLG
jgi:hypothetical protein